MRCFACLYNAYITLLLAVLRSSRQIRTRVSLAAGAWAWLTAANCLNRVQVSKIKIASFEIRTRCIWLIAIVTYHCANCARNTYALRVTAVFYLDFAKLLSCVLTAVTAHIPRIYP